MLQRQRTVLIDIVWLKSIAVLVLFFPTSSRSSPRHSFSCLFIRIGLMYTHLPFLQLKPLSAQIEQWKGWLPTSKKDAADILYQITLQILCREGFHFQLSPRAFPVSGEDPTELHCVGETPFFLNRNCKVVASAEVFLNWATSDRHASCWRIIKSKCSCSAAFHLCLEAMC